MQQQLRLAVPAAVCPPVLHRPVGDDQHHRVARQRVPQPLDPIGQPPEPSCELLGALPARGVPACAIQIEMRSVSGGTPKQTAPCT